jgi:putative flippase GtrA
MHSQVATRIPGWLSQFVVYGLVGVISTALDWGTFYFTNSMLLMHYALCTFISVLIGSGANFLLNRVVTFKNKSKQVGTQLLKYSAVAAVSILLSVAWMFVFVRIIGLVPLTGRISTTLIMYPINFVVVKLFVFGSRTEWAG